MYRERQLELEEQARREAREKAVSSCSNLAAKMKSIESALLKGTAKQAAEAAKKKARSDDAGPVDQQDVNKDTSDKASVGETLNTMGGGHSNTPETAGSEISRSVGDKESENSNVNADVGTLGTFNTQEAAPFNPCRCTFGMKSDGNE
jgi:hypothetical protein